MFHNKEKYDKIGNIDASLANNAGPNGKWGIALRDPTRYFSNRFDTYEWLQVTDNE